MSTRIVALDPGGTTGWAYVDIRDDGTLEFHHGMLESQNHHNELRDLLYGLLYNLEGHRVVEYYNIVCESFEYRNASRPGLELVSVEYIGVMKLFCQEFNIPYHMQSASQGKIRDKPTAFVKPDNLKKLGLWSPNMIHAMDAYGHLLYFLINDQSKVNFAAGALHLLNKGWKTN